MINFGNFTFEETPIDGLKIISTRKFDDVRGSFQETYNQESFKAAGISDFFCQDNQSFSKKGVLRGLHFQKPFFQSKLVRVLSGRVYDVAVDLREDSATYKSFFGIELKPDGTMFYIPEGFAHGFLALEDSIFSYKCGALYDQKGDTTIDYRSVNIPWAQVASENFIEEFIVSEKDLRGISL
jgi:dTDP-4-dehydrorhamnose 3,5-epimerase